MSSEIKNVIGADDAPFWIREWQQHEDGWRALLVGRYPSIVVALPAEARRQGFIAIVDGEPIEGCDEMQPFVHATYYDAIFAAWQHVQDGCMGRCRRRPPRYVGGPRGGVNSKYHDDMVRKWLRLL
jgi:hypothetical protein